jgi:cell division protein FtsQ
MRSLIRRRPAAVAAPHDPAPSRVRYRIERLWLTPLFRALLRTGVPSFSVVILITWYIADPVRLDGLMQKAASIRQSIEERPEFMVKLMSIDGASDELSYDIREILPIDLPVSQFSLDLEELRTQLEGLDPVRSADVRIRPGGMLAVTVVERTPAVIWRTENGVELLAADGHRVSSILHPSQRPELPQVAGEGAQHNVPEALRLIAAAAPLADRLLGLQRIGARRWDVVLLDGKRILLPERDPGLALDRALALQAAQDVLSRDIVALDYRNRQRPAVRMTQAAQEEWRRIKDIELLSAEEQQ